DEPNMAVKFFDDNPKSDTFGSYVSLPKTYQLLATTPNGNGTTYRTRPGDPQSYGTGRLCGKTSHFTLLDIESVSVAKLIVIENVLPSVVVSGQAATFYVNVANYSTVTDGQINVVT